MDEKEPNIYFEISCIYKDVVNGNIVVDGKKAGFIQFDLNKLCSKAIRRIRKKGIPVKFLPATKMSRES